MKHRQIWARVSRVALDEATLTQWMKQNVAGFSGALDVSQCNGGQSNSTYLLTSEDRRNVLRRKPPGELLTGAHGQADIRQMLIIGAVSRLNLMGRKAIAESSWLPDTMRPDRLDEMG